MNESSLFRNVEEGLRNDSSTAQNEVFKRFRNRLIGLARRRLEGAIRQKVDPDDVLQSVYRTFFRRAGDGQFELDSWDDLWSLLVVITLRKCGRQVTHFRTAGRDLRRESPLQGTDGSHGIPIQQEAVDREPTPDEAAALNDAIERIMAGLDHREQTIFSLRLRGFTVQEIGVGVDRSERTVHRVLGHVRLLMNNVAAECEAAN